MPAPTPRPQLYPTPRLSLGLSDAYTDILGGEPLQANMSGSNTDINAAGASAVVMVSAGGPTGKQVVIPASLHGGDVTWVRGLYATTAVPRYDAFMADMTGADINNYAAIQASFTGSISGTNLTVTSIIGPDDSYGRLTTGHVVSGGTVLAGTAIVSQSSGTVGGTGVYVVSTSQTAASANLIASVPAGNKYAGGVLSTVVPVISTVATGTQMQAYYSYRDGTRSVKGQAMAGYPMLHVDPYQGTADDGDNYMMAALMHAYLTTRDTKYRALALRIGNALVDAAAWSSNKLTFDIPFAATDGQVGFYSYNAPTTPFTVQNVPLGLQIQTTVNSSGPPYNYAGIGFWPSVPVTPYSTFRSLDITMIGDGSGRGLLVNLNTDPAKGEVGDYYARITLLPQTSYAQTLFSLAPSDFAKVENIVYDAAHQDYSYVGCYGSDANAMGVCTDVANNKNIVQFSYDFSGNSSGYAGMYFGPADGSSAGTTALHISVFAQAPGVAYLTATDSAAVDHRVYFILEPGWTDYVIPWVGSIPPGPISLPNSAGGFYDPTAQAQWAGIYFGPGVVGFSQTTFAHPVTQLAIDVVGTLAIPQDGNNAWAAFFYAGMPFIRPVYWAGAYVYPRFNVANTLALDHVSYDGIVTMASITPTVLNGVQISFPSNDAGTPYSVSFQSIEFKMDTLDGPTTDPLRYAGLPRWTDKWLMVNGYVGYGAWRGPSAVGYLWMGGWQQSGIVNPVNGRLVADQMLTFMADSQAAYSAQFPAQPPGPFAPRYGRPSWEAINTKGYVAGALQLSTYNKWYWPDTDDWYGYTYRALLSVAQHYYYSRSATAKAILDKWMTWLDAKIVADGAYWWPPSIFYNDGTVGYTYRPLYSYALIAGACIYKYWVDGDAIAAKWYRRLLDDIFARQRQTVTGRLAGIYPVAEGSGYTTATVVFACNGTAPSATCVISGGKVTSYRIVSPGSGMTYCTTAITGDGSGAAGNAYLTDDLVGAFSDSHTGWEAAEVFNTYAMLVNGARAGGTVSFATSATANDLAAFAGLIAFYQRTARDTRPSMMTADWVPLHEYRVDPYHDGSAIENPMVKDTHAKGAMWTETIGPTITMAVEYGRYSGDWSWLDTLYALSVELTGNIRNTAMAVFPVLPGIAWGVTKTPSFNTQSFRAASGYEVRAALMQYPLWTFQLSYEFLRDTVAAPELKTLVGFFNACKGSFAAFLYTDPTDNAVTQGNFGTGNGSTLSFQLSRSYGGFFEPVQNLNTTPSIYVNGVLKTLTTDYSISATGLVTFVTAPPSGQAVTWSGTFYYRVRFVNDSAEFNQFMYTLFELKKLEFVGSPMNKV